ncbi:MAG: ATP-binding protein [Actinomycetota bacterium]
MLFARSRSNRVVAGVAGGLGRRFGIDPTILRIAFGVLALAGGAGVAFYLLLWAVSDEADSEPEAEPAPSGGRQAVAVGLIVTGLMLPLRRAGIWFGDALVVPLAIGALGSAVIWARSGEDERARWTRMAARLPGNPRETLFGQRISLPRVAIGGVLIAVGMASFIAFNETLLGSSSGIEAIRNILVAIVVTIAGVTLIAAPGVMRLFRTFSEERRGRIRSEERAEMAAHLHDSVLQTLALIQRARESKEMVSLARGQERELRAWLYGQTGGIEGDLLSSAVDAMASRVEHAYQVKVEPIVVGDEQLDETLQAVVAACGEAATNAARHSQSEEVAVYIEVEPETVTAYVRDQGAGFDLDSIPQDRHGIAESIVGRIERHGGGVTITTAPGEGTEIAISVPRRDQS